MRRRRPAVLIVTLLALAAAVLFGRAIATRWARYAAARHIDAGEIAAAERWLARAAWLDADDYRTYLMQAACFRHLGRQEGWETALAAARRKAAGRDVLRLEDRLGALRWGRIDPIAPGDVDDLVKRGASPREAVTAVVYGLLAKGEQKSADELIRTWAANSPGDGYASYLRGVTSWWSGELESAQFEFEQALDRQPRREPVRAALARLLEERYDLTRALVHYAELARTAPRREAAVVDLARVLRKLGRPADARSVLRGPASEAEVSTAAALELAETEYESGNYAVARGWFQRAHLDRAHVADTLRAAASASALNGAFADARQLFDRVDEAQDLARQLSEWRRRRALDPGDGIAARELARLSEAAAVTRPASLINDPSTPPVSAIYLQHCASCHGSDGNGSGRAARHLFPRPRDLRTGRVRLIGTLNGIPTLEDIEQVIRQGMPGTAMPSFADLSPDERRQLAQQVQQFRREGIREQYLSRIRNQGDAADEAELAQIIARLTTPGTVLRVPTVGAADVQSITRGSDLYLSIGCRQCHGEQGAGVFDLLLFDEEDGRPALPRDLVHDRMKGGSDGESLYKRIRLGMPGTPHPAVTTLGEGELIDLVHFCQSLADASTQNLTNYQRARQAARRTSVALLGRFPASPTPAPRSD